MNMMMRIGTAMVAPPVIVIFGMGVFVFAKAAISGSSNLPPEADSLLPWMVLSLYLILPGLIVFGIGAGHGPR